MYMKCEGEFSQQLQYCSRKQTFHRLLKGYPTENQVQEQLYRHSEAGAPMGENSLSRYADWT
jgi:hypothetical protein